MGNCTAHVHSRSEHSRGMIRCPVFGELLIALDWCSPRGRHFCAVITAGRLRLAVLRPCSESGGTASFDDCSFLVSKVGQTQRIPFASLRARTLSNGWFFDSIRIEVEKSTPILLKGIGRSRSRIAFEKLASKRTFQWDTLGKKPNDPMGGFRVPLFVSR